jgi:hypothetical protein
MEGEEPYESRVKACSPMLTHTHKQLSLSDTDFPALTVSSSSQMSLSDQKAVTSDSIMGFGQARSARDALLAEPPATSKQDR